MADEINDPGRHVQDGGAWRLLKRLFRLWALYARMDLLWVLRDMRMFLMWTVTDSMVNVAAVMGMWLLAERFDGIGHWSKLQVLFMLGYGTVSTGLLETFFGFNVGFISRRLGRGQLDHTLVQPQPIWLSLLTDGFVPFAGSAFLLPGVVLLAWAAAALRIAVTPGWLAALVINLLASMVVTLSFQFLWGSLAFWSPRAAEEINSSTLRLVTQLKSFPLDGLGALVKGGLLTALPVGFVAWYPCRALLGLRAGPWSLWGTSLAALVFAALAYAMFQAGLKHYGRTGSQRYLGWGHRS
jgi:ABC-2 type transport system permease protein